MILGFDTSNYTTSTASVTDNDILNIRQILDVKEGMRGLRQSDALFLHIKNLPRLYKELRLKSPNEIEAVGVSIKPRNVEGSYMPCFLAGENFAVACAESLKVPLYTYSHQDGHIMAGIYSADCMDFLDGEDFISVHLSGGTTEILKSRYNNYHFESEIIGGTKDISAGQLIDRVGVMLGLKFPCGVELSKYAIKCKCGVTLPVTVKDTWLNMSGTETKASSLIADFSKEEVSRGVIDSISKALSKALNNTINTYKIKRILLVGGVASNTILREYLLSHLNCNVKFASVELSSDNAVGIAKLAQLQFNNTTYQQGI